MTRYVSWININLISDSPDFKILFIDEKPTVAHKQPMCCNKYVDSRTFIGKTVDVQIDRPLGSSHPEQDLVYPVNYGYLPGVPGLDGEDLDAYVLGVDTPVKCFSGRCIAVIRRTDDPDDKLVVVPDGMKYTDEQIRDLTEFQEQFFESSITRISVESQ